MRISNAASILALLSRGGSASASRVPGHALGAPFHLAVDIDSSLSDARTGGGRRDESMEVEGEERRTNEALLPGIGGSIQQFVDEPKQQEAQETIQKEACALEVSVECKTEESGIDCRDLTNPKSDDPSECIVDIEYTYGVINAGSDPLSVSSLYRIRNGEYADLSSKVGNDGLLSNGGNGGGATEVTEFVTVDLCDPRKHERTLYAQAFTVTSEGEEENCGGQQVYEFSTLPGPTAAPTVTSTPTAVPTKGPTNVPTGGPAASPVTDQPSGGPTMSPTGVCAVDVTVGCTSIADGTDCALLPYPSAYGSECMVKVKYSYTVTNVGSYPEDILHLYRMRNGEFKDLTSGLSSSTLDVDGSEGNETSAATTSESVTIDVCTSQIFERKAMVTAVPSEGGPECVNMFDYNFVTSWVPPTAHPTSVPSFNPTPAPSGSPTSSPTPAPSGAPSSTPTSTPTDSPSDHPTPSPSANPSSSPTGFPTLGPTGSPTFAPTANCRLTAQVVCDTVDEAGVKILCADILPPPDFGPDCIKSVRYRYVVVNMGMYGANVTGLTRMINDESDAGAGAAGSTADLSDQLGYEILPVGVGAIVQEHVTVNVCTRTTFGRTVTVRGVPMTAGPECVSIDSTSFTTDWVEPTDSPTPSPSVTPSGGPSATPTTIPSDSPSANPSGSPSGSPTSAPSGGPSGSPSANPTSSPSSVPSAGPTGKPTVSPTDQPSSSPSATPTAKPTPSPSSSPSGAPTNNPTDGPTPSPSSSPSGTPSASPSAGPTSAPTESPSAHPSAGPTAGPTENPTDKPTDVPTNNPSASPSSTPTSSPSSSPSASPTSTPTTASPSATPTSGPGIQTKSSSYLTSEKIDISYRNPSAGMDDWIAVYEAGSENVEDGTVPFAVVLMTRWQYACGSQECLGSVIRGTAKFDPIPPGQYQVFLLKNTGDPYEVIARSEVFDVMDLPTSSPTSNPTTSPTESPTKQPTTSPSDSPSASPSATPTAGPTGSPSGSPSASPSASPTGAPTSSPSTSPSGSPTAGPTPSPSGRPSSSPTSKPTSSPTDGPSSSPSASPTGGPTPSPTEAPTDSPTSGPTGAPTFSPTDGPTNSPTDGPTSAPTAAPSATPTDAPTGSPTDGPSSLPSLVLSANPSNMPTSKPTFRPTAKPSKTPTTSPTGNPATDAPTGGPTGGPTENPTAVPTVAPVPRPTRDPTGEPIATPVSVSPTQLPTYWKSLVPTSVPTIPTASKVNPVPIIPTASSSTPSSGSPTEAPKEEENQAPPTQSRSPPFSEHSAAVYIRLVGVSSEMNAADTNIFEKTAQAFVFRTMSEAEDVDVAITGVTVVSQEVTASTSNGGGRALEEDHNRRSLQSSSDLQVQLQIQGQVSPYQSVEDDDSFPFSQSVLTGFVNNFDSFTDDLYDASAFFAPLGHSIKNPAAGAEDSNQRPTEGATPSSSSEEGGDNIMMIAIIAGSSVAGLALAISCAAFAVRRRRMTGGSASRDDSSEASKDVYPIGSGDQSLDSGLTPYGMNGTSLPSLNVSPNAMEKGGSWDAKGAMSPFNLSEFSMTDKSLVDDSMKSVSTGDSVQNQQNVGLRLTPDVLYEAAKKAKEMSASHDHQREEDESFVPNFDDGIQQQASAGSNSSGGSGMGGNPLNYTHADNIIGDQFDMDAILQGGGSGLESKDSAAAEEGGRTAPDGGFMGARGAAAMAAEAGSPTGNATNISSLRSSSTDGTGLTSQGEVYDCYAPPGPLGIVIDTTADGPVIHSLKPTSQLLGLINAGDLVIALDDIDTRGMTAATVTRLMAKRSQQPQRKITLLRGSSM